MTTNNKPVRTAIQADHPTMRRPHRPRAFAVLGSAAAALAVWTVTVPLAGAHLTVRMNGATQPVGPGAVVTASLLAGLAGWALLATLERFGHRPRRAWTGIAVLVLALSLAGPLGSGVHSATTMALAGMHLAVGAVLIPALRHSARC
ncbi:DUF6069 family protein [Streptomyces sp. H10-C2]|uniref:DUF6069 family protein n=1 Tax=unclassified Streptomyces TaxID=2593676 RepID=UPI0024B984E7|nr:MULTISPECIES: DUF6069 family protein [unclassified Streptomyces]MDJ0347414.1 DUF6069 family protein [Streptomyces sp. PH10-H1]MDJ0375693.1 DUF6069 family protein [Streptomyces sp. H10-C2]